MKKLITILLLCASLQSHAQKITLDSLNTIIITLQKQVQFLMLQRTITFDSTQMKVTSIDSLNQFITIKPTLFTGSALAVKDSADIAAIKTKIAGLKVISTIQ